jgi:hypothetical protein
VFTLEKISFELKTINNIQRVVIFCSINDPEITSAEKQKNIFKIYFNIPCKKRGVGAEN